MDPIHVVRLGLMLTNMTTKKFTNLYWRVEARALDLLEEISGFQLSQVFLSLSHAEKMRMVGTQKGFVKFETKIMSSKIHICNLSHIMFAYAARGFGNPELHSHFVKELYAGIEEMDMTSLANVVYYLMLTENLDADLW